MIKAGMTVKEAAQEWVNGFSKFPQDMIDKLMAMDVDSWREVTLPRICDRVYVNTLPDDCESEECSGEITNLIPDCDLYQITLDDGTVIEIGEDDFEVERDCSLPMWGWLWQFGDSADDYWLSNMDGIKLMSRCGFRVYEHDEWGYFFGIDGAGYDFYDEHWCPLYRARGLQWHDPAAEKELQMRRKGYRKGKLGGKEVWLDAQDNVVEEVNASVRQAV